MATEEPGGRTAQDEAPLTPEESFELIESQTRVAQRRLGVNPAPIFAMWGLAFLLGWGAFYLAAPQGPGPFLPLWGAGVILGVLFAAAIGLPIMQGVRGGRGVTGPSRTAGAMYGWAWTLGFCAMAAIDLGIMRQDLSTATVSLLWTGTALLVVGLMYLAGGVLWRDRVQYGLGVWMLITAAGSVFAGFPGNLLVLSLAGGCGMLAQGVYYRIAGVGQ